MHHARTVAADILAKEEDAVGLLKIFKRDGSDRDSNALRERYGGALVTHIGGIRKVVASIKTRHQGIYIGRFQRSAAGGIKDDGFGIVSLKTHSNIMESIFPSNR